MKKWLLAFLFITHIFSLKATEGTVVALHGFLSDSRSMRFVAKALRCKGIGVTLWDYSSRERTIELHAYNLVACLQKIASLNPGKPIHFVAHSSSSLILRAAVNTPGFPCEAKIGKTVLLAPPNKGSWLARRFKHLLPVKLAFGNRSGRQLMTYNEWQILECFGSFPSEMQILVIRGTKGSDTLFGPQISNDGFITAYETTLEIPYYSLCFPVSHSELLTNKPVLAAIRNFILWP